MSDAPNAAQIEHWNGPDAQHWVRHAERYDAMLAPFADLVFEAAAIEASDRVLDVGCGTGATTIAAARHASSGHASGVDISQSMIEAARSRAAREGVRNASFDVRDVQTAELGGPHDVAISRFGVMFFDDPAAAFTNLRAALVPGGRLAFVCWQPLLVNPWMLVPAAAAAEHVGLPPQGDPEAPGPFAFGDADRVARILDAAGFAEVAIRGHEQRLLLGGARTADDAVGFLTGTTVARAMFADQPPEAVEAATAAMRDAITPYITDDGVRIDSAVWLVQAARPQGDEA